MLINYLLKKISNRVYLRGLRKEKIFSNIYHIGTRQKAIRSVLFYFPDPTFMNLGDHLFFEPVCRLFRDNGYEVLVWPITSMIPYFKSCGYRICQKDVHHFDLVISRPDFIQKINLLRNVLIIDIAYAGINKPLIDDINEKLMLYFDMQVICSSKPAYALNTGKVVEKLNISDKEEYIVYNNYLKSGSFRVGKNKYKKLDLFVRQFITRIPTLKVIHCGSMEDKKKDNTVYDFVTLDARGETMVADLFDLCALPNVKYYIGFDAFLMHLFFLQEKKAYVLSRGRWTKKERFFLEHYIDPPYSVVNVNKIKEYIKLE